MRSMYLKFIRLKITFYFFFCFAETDWLSHVHRAYFHLWNQINDLNRNNFCYQGGLSPNKVIRYSFNIWFKFRTTIIVGSSIQLTITNGSPFILSNESENHITENPKWIIFISVVLFYVLAIRNSLCRFQFAITYSFVSDHSLSEYNC